MVHHHPQLTTQLASASAEGPHPALLATSLQACLLLTLLSGVRQPAAAQVIPDRSLGPEPVVHDDAPNYLQEALDAPKPDPYDIQKTSLADFFNASPETVATLLGPPLDSPDNSPESNSLNYSPTSFEPFFPEPTFFKSLSVRYDQGQAIAINLYLRMPMPTLNGEEINTLDLTTMFAQGLFTDPALSYEEVYSAHPGESLQYSYYCVADGIATSVIDGQFYDLNFFQEPDCQG